MDDLLGSPIEDLWKYDSIFSAPGRVCIVVCNKPPQYECIDTKFCGYFFSRHFIPPFNQLVEVSEMRIFTVQKLEKKISFLLSFDLQIFVLADFLQPWIDIMVVDCIYLRSKVLLKTSIFPFDHSRVTDVHHLMRNFFPIHFIYTPSSFGCSIFKWL